MFKVDKKLNYGRDILELWSKKNQYKKVTDL